MSTRKVVSLAVALALATVAATPAFAVTVSRADGQPMNASGEPFSVTGVTNLSKGVTNVQCQATFNGTITPSGIVNITSTTCTGGTLCGFISGVTPWTGQADSTTQLTINNAAVNVLLLGSCGPSSVATAWDNNASSLTFTNASMAPDCTVGGTVYSSPKFKVTQ